MGTVSKALSLLNFFTRDRAEIGLSEMTRLAGLNKATTFRLMTELAENGFVEQVGAGRAYRLGPVFLRLAGLRESAVPMREVAQDVLTRLSDATGETSHMSILQGDSLCALTYAYSVRHGTRVTMGDAAILDFHATSSGLAVLAHAPEDMVEQVLAGPLTRRTPLSETDPGVIRRHLAEVRATGIAESVSGFEEDVHSHASPVFDAQLRCYGAVAVAAPVARMTAGLRDLIRQEVPRAALEMTRLLGGFAPDDFKSRHDTRRGHAPAA